MVQSNLTESSLVLTLVKRGIDMIRNYLLIISFVLSSSSSTFLAASRSFPKLFNNPFKQLVNSPPIAVDDSISIKPFQEKAVDVLSNDYDRDGHSLRIISLSEQNPRKKKTKGVKQRISSMGCQAHISASKLKILLSCSDSYPYGRKLFYTIADERGTTSSARLYYKITEVEKKCIKPKIQPVSLLAKDDIGKTYLNQSIILDVLANDKYSRRLRRNRANHKIIKISNISGGIAELVSNNRKIKVTPAVDSRKPVTFSYMIGTETNNSTANVKVLVRDYSAKDDIGKTYLNQSIILDVLKNDNVDYRNHKISKISDISGGIVELVSNSRKIKVTPAVDSRKPITFSYTIGTKKNKSTANVKVLVHEIIAKDDIGTTNMNQSIILDVLKNDTVDYRSRKIIKISNISGGIADLVSDNRKIKVTPAVDSLKPVTFSYTIGTKNNKSTADVKVLITEL